MAQLNQKPIEYFFKKYNISDPDKKAKILPEVTDIIYDYNMHVVGYEKEKDEYKREQLLVGLKELEGKLEEIFKKYK